MGEQWINQINQTGSNNCFHLHDARIAALDQTELTTSTTHIPTSKLIQNNAKIKVGEQEIQTVSIDGSPIEINLDTLCENMGLESTYKPKQNPKASPNTSGGALAFIDTISQDINGVITATKKSIITITSSDEITTDASSTGLPTGKAVADYITTYINSQGFSTTDTNTTYSFSGGTNQFTVTPSDSTPQTITITPSFTSATSNDYGGIKIGYTANEKNYPVQLNANGQAFVNVPWYSGETSYTLPKATTTTLGGVTIGEHINVIDGKISITSSNISDALGYQPSSGNTTYSAGSGLVLSTTNQFVLNYSYGTASASGNSWPTGVINNPTNSPTTGALYFQIES